MSPLSLRRFRAERLLRREFDALRVRVLAAVQARLRGCAIELDRGEVEAAYAVAWQGLYAAQLAGEQIDSPASWLVVVTFRRAVGEHRARRRVTPAGAWPGAGIAAERLGPAPAEDLAEGLHDRVRLEQLLEGLSRLSERERQAATLCYLQGLSRAEAAAQMGIGEVRMRKLMEGHGRGRPGVSGKVGALAKTIEEGRWCESQGSLMRAFAYGILDRDGERYRLALGHHRRCPSCRAYVLSLRGLAAALPPVLLPGGRSVLARLGGGEGAGSVLARLAGARGGAGSRGAAGAGGGGVALAGPFGAKLAVGCLMAAGIGAGCIGLAREPRGPAPGRARAHASLAASRRPGVRLLAVAGAPAAPARAAPAGVRPAEVARPAAAAVREFGPEQLAAATGVPGPPAGAANPLIRPRARASVEHGHGPAAMLAAARSPAQARAAAREFGP